MVIANNMREARLHGMSRNMATPSTCITGSTKKYEMVVPGITRNSTLILLHLEISTRSRRDCSRNSCKHPAYGRWLAQAALARQNLNGENGTKSRLTGTIQRTNAISEGIEYAIQNGY